MWRVNINPDVRQVSGGGSLKAIPTPLVIGEVNQKRDFPKLSPADSAGRVRRRRISSRN